jgi:hypothetical protein
MPLSHSCKMLQKSVTKFALKTVCFLTPPDTQSAVRRPNSLRHSSTKPAVRRLRRRSLSFNFCFLPVDGMTCIVYRFVANETIDRMVRITAQVYRILRCKSILKSCDSQSHPAVKWPVAKSAFTLKTKLNAR